MAGKLSNRGGYREKAGRKSDWKHPATKSIRVPPEIADQVVEIAKKIDSAYAVSDIDSVAESNITVLSKADWEVIAQEVLSDPVVTRKGKDGGTVKRTLKAVMDRLQSK